MFTDTSNNLCTTDSDVDEKLLCCFFKTPTQEHIARKQFWS